MKNPAIFVLENTVMGIGLAMDAFSVSLANGLGDPSMKKRTAVKIAAVFAFFQALMPMIGWVCVHYAAKQFDVFHRFVPYIAFILLAFIGGKMLYEGISELGEGTPHATAAPKHSAALTLLVQGVATSIDALSVGFTIADYNLREALLAVAVIALVTFVICLFGVIVGKNFGTHLAGKAGILGGGILIVIGIEILVSSLV